MADTTYWPVLAIGINVDNVGGGWVAPEADRQPTLPALAVPDALWSDPEFRDACIDRWGDKHGAWYLFDAIAAELRERANLSTETPHADR